MDGIATVKKTFSIALDVSRSISNREFTVVEGDTGNVLCITLTDDGEAIGLSGCRVMALFSKSDGTTVSQDSGTQGNGVTIGGTAGNEITIALFASSFAPGMVECEIQIYSGATLATLVTTAKFNFKCRRGILNSDTVEAVPEYPLLVTLMNRTADLEEQANTALASATTAISAATAATAAASAAEQAAQTGETARVSAESARATAEANRATAENARATAETNRAAAETARASAFTTLEGRMDAAADAAEGASAALVNAAAELPALYAINGLIKGTGSGAAQAVAGTDYAIPAVDITATLSTTWAGSAAPYTQSISISGMTAAKKIQVGLAASCTAAQYAAAEKAKLLCSAQGTGSITVTAFGTKPTVAIPILVRVVG